MVEVGNASMGANSANSAYTLTANGVTDKQLLARLRQWNAAERHATASVVELLAEFDRRRLWLRSGYQSLRAFAMIDLGYSEAAAFTRIRAARLARQYPEVVGALRSGQIHLAGLCALSPILSADNVREWLEKCAGKSKRVIEAMVASAHPAAAPSERGRMQVEPLGRLDGEPVTAEGGQAPAMEDMMVKVTLVVGGELLVKLDKSRDLLSHAIPSGDPEEILSRALDLLSARCERNRFGVPRPERKEQPEREQAERDREENHSSREEREEKQGQQERDEPKDQAPGAAPKPKVSLGRQDGRYIPVDIRRRVWERDGGKCVYEGPNGECCGSARFLEFHHIVAFRRGGVHSIENLELRCHAHNHLASLEEYGPEVAEFFEHRRREPERRKTEATE